MKKELVGHYRGTPIYCGYKANEKLQTKFIDRCNDLLDIMYISKDIYKLQFMFDGDEVYIKRTEEYFEIGNVTYITIV